MTVPFVLYNDDDFTRWAANTTETNRLAADGQGLTSRSITADFGTQLALAELTAARTQSVHAVAMGVLWRATGNAAYRTKGMATVNAYAQITSVEMAASETQRLNMSWIMPNLAKACALLDYLPAGLVTFARQVALPQMDWKITPNWHATMALSQVMWGVLLEDANLYASAVGYFQFRLPQGVYWRTVDNSLANVGATGRVVPIRGSSGSPSVDNTRKHWGGGSLGDTIITTELLATDPDSGLNLLDGTPAEAGEDLAHPTMALDAYTQTLRTILLHENTDPSSYYFEYQRIRLAYAFHAPRVLAYVNDEAIPNMPVASTIPGGQDYHYGWHGAARLLGDDTPAAVTSLIAHEEISTWSPSGANHSTCQPLADCA